MLDGPAGHGRNCYKGYRAGLGLQVVLVQKATESHPPLLLSFAEGQWLWQAISTHLQVLAKGTLSLCSAAQWSPYGALGLSGALLDSRVSVSWDKSWCTRSIVKVWPTHLRGWIHVVPFLLPVAIFFLRTWCQTFSASYFLQMIAVSWQYGGGRASRGAV